MLACNCMGNESDMWCLAPMHICIDGCAHSNQCVEPEKGDRKTPTVSHMSASNCKRVQQTWEQVLGWVVVFAPSHWHWYYGISVNAMSVSLHHCWWYVGAIALVLMLCWHKCHLEISMANNGLVFHLQQNTLLSLTWNLSALVFYKNIPPIFIKYYVSLTKFHARSRWVIT